MFSIKDLDVALADIKNTNVTYMAVKDLLFWPTWGSQAPRLPVAYQEVEYIQASWSQYIDTWYAPNNNTKIYAKFAHWAAQNQWPLFWARWRSWYTEYNYQYILWTHCSEYNQGGTAMDNKPCPLFCHEYSTSSTSWWIKFLDTRYPAWTVIEFEYDKTWWYYWPDNTWTWSPATNTASINMLIFGLREWTTIDSRKFDWKLFAFKVWESWVIKRDFVPCYRKEDGEIWLYDLVNNEFYNNKWSWTFTMWWDTRKSVLPRWYSEIQYIQSTATNPWTVTSSWQYIDTLYTPNQYTKIAIDMQFQNLTRQSRLFAIHDTNTSYMTMAAYINWSDKWARAMKNWEWDWLSTEVAVDTNRHTFTLKNWNYKIQTGNTVNYNSSNATSSSTSARHTLPLLAAWDFAENKIVDHASAKIYWCTIFEKDVMIRNFMPCVSKYWEVWLYDFVEWKFYPNAWTWEFAPWPRVYYEDSINISKDWLLWYWPLSSDLKDYSWNKNDWKWYSWTGAFSKAASKDWARVTTNNPLSTQHIITALNYCQAPITVGWWVCYNAMNSNAWHGMISNSSASGNGCTIWTRPADNNYPSAVIASWTVVRIDSVVPSTNKWYFWMATNDGTTLKTYQNWVLTNSWPVSSFTNWWVWKLWCAMVDGWQTVNSWTDWWVRHCFVYNRVLDWDEAMEVYKKTSCSERWKSDLTFCDYIESTGTQWIDTGLTWAQADDVEMEFSFPNQPSAVAVPMWVRWESSVADSVIRINESNMIEPRFWSWINTGVEMLAKTKYKVRTEFKSWAQKVYVNDVQKATWSLTYTYNASRTYYLFAFRDTSDINCKCSCRMYSCKIKLWDTVVRNFVPCFVKYTGEAGMWDTVNEKFYPNIWTWSFWKWFNKFNPEDYQKVEYIKTTWTQWIDTWYKYWWWYMKISAKFLFNSFSYWWAEWDTPFVYWVIWRTYWNYYLAKRNSSQSTAPNKFEFWTWTAYNTSITVQTSTIYDTMLEYNSWTMNMDINWTTFTTSSTWTMYQWHSLPIFWRRDINLSWNWMWYIATDMRLYSFKIYSSPNTLFRNFIPVYRKSDNVIWLYDLINDYFYTNAWSGSFAKGRDVHEKKDLAFCDYIQSTWTQYINTEEKWTQNTKIETTFAVTGVVWNYDFYYWAYWDTSNSWQYCMFLQSNYPDNNKIRVVNYANGGSGKKYVDSLNNLELNRKYNITHTNTSFIIDWVNQWTMWASTFTTNYNMTIFGIVWGNINKMALMKLYSFKMYSWNTLIKDFKPCYIKKTWEAWLWDEVGQKFYWNDWTWSFVREGQEQPVTEEYVLLSSGGSTNKFSELSLTGSRTFLNNTSNWAGSVATTDTFWIHYKIFDKKIVWFEVEMYPTDNEYDWLNFCLIPSSSSFNSNASRWIINWLWFWNNAQEYNWSSTWRVGVSEVVNSTGTTKFQQNKSNRTDTCIFTWKLSNWVWSISMSIAWGTPIITTFTPNSSYWDLHWIWFRWSRRWTWECWYVRSVKVILSE